MPRPIDSQRHRARRLQIIDAGLTAFAERGYAGATTAVICRTAGIGSGTFFHYFPTKDALLVAIIDHSTCETREFFHQRADVSDPYCVILEYVDHAVAGLVDPRAAGFIAMVGGLTHRPDIAAALRADNSTACAGLRIAIRSAQGRGRVRRDITAERLAEWILLVLDGFASKVVSSDTFIAKSEAAMLNEQITLLLRGLPQQEHNTSHCRGPSGSPLRGPLD